MSERDNMDLTPEEQRLQDSVRGLGEVRADEAFRARLREQFMSGELAAQADAPVAETKAEPKVVDLPPRRRPRRRWAALIAVAAALAVVFLFQGEVVWKLQAVRGDGTVVINDQELPTSDQAAIAALIAPQAHISVPAGVEMDVVLGKVMVVGVAGPAEIVMPSDLAAEPASYQFTVNDGEFRIKTGPDFPGSEALLLTSEGRVEITGTSVAVFKNDDLTCVCVLEGTAMIGRDTAHLDPIPAGMRKVMFTDGSDPMITTIEPGHKQGLLEFEKFNQDTFK